jgi:hypothetical protein
MSLPKIVADLETSLATKIAVGETTGTIVSNVDDDGVTLADGTYYFTLDGNNSAKEHIKCTKTGTALSDIYSVSRQGVETEGCVREHRVGAKVIMTDYATYKNYFQSALSDFVSKTQDETIAGVKTFSSSPIVPTPTNDTDAANKEYVDAKTGSALAVEVNQVAHGFAVGDVIRLDGENTYAKALADSAANAEVVGIVTIVSGDDDFSYTTEGAVTAGVPDETPGTVLFLSDTVAGELTATAPTTQGHVSMPLATIVEAEVKMVFHKYRGMVLGSGTAQATSVATYTATGTTLSLTTQANDKVVVWAKGNTGAPSSTATIELKYDGVQKDIFSAPNNDQRGCFALQYSETPGAKTADVTVTSDQSGMSQVVIIAQVITPVDTSLSAIEMETYEAGENITSGDAVAITASTNQVVSTLVTHTTDNTNKSFGQNNWFAQSFTTSSVGTRIDNVTIKVAGDGNSRFLLAIRDSLTGSNLWDGEVIAPGNTTFSFSPKLTVTPSTTYYLVIYNHFADYNHNLRVDNTDTYGTVHSSTNAGSSWSTDSGYRWYMTILESSGVANIAYKASGASFDYRLNFIGFATSSVSTGQNLTINTSSKYSSTGLTPGAYYLSDTPGEISTSAGTISRWVGEAISTTLLHRRLNRKRKVSGWISLASTLFNAPAPMQIQMVHQGTIVVDGVTVTGGTDTDATPYIEAGDLVSVTGGKYILLQ